MKKWFLIRAFDAKKLFSDLKLKRAKRKAEKIGFSFPDDNNKYILCIAINSIILDNIINF